VLFEQVSTRRRQCTFWTQGRLQGCKARLSVGLEGLLGGTHRQHPEGWGCFPGTWASLLPEAPCQAEDAWSGGSGGWGGRGLPRLRGSSTAVAVTPSLFSYILALPLFFCLFLS